MLKLPKGLKKKKKGKKSKKNQELFTEEELEQYKREQREKHRQEAVEVEEDKTEQKESINSVPLSSGGNSSGVINTSASGNKEKKLQEGADDDEWSKFKALTTGIDTVLKKTQGDLDRIKESSFYQRVVPPPQPPQPSQQTTDAEKRKAEQQNKKIVSEKGADQLEKADANSTKKEYSLAEAVIELSESEEESEETDDIFDTTYIDVITSGDLQLAYVPESPTDDIDEGPDPFDTSYADKVIKGPEVSKRGKKIVNIGSAVEVLTGRVEKLSSTAVARRPRRGPINLLLESFDEGGAVDHPADVHLNASNSIVVDQSAHVKSLLDDLPDDFSDAPIDLSVSLHLTYQKEQQQQQQDELKNEDDNTNTLSKNIVTEFDVLTVEHIDANNNNNNYVDAADDDDEFAELAVESLNKKDKNLTVAFESSGKGKPARPPPPSRPITGPTNIQQKKVVESNEEELDFSDDTEDDPFDTTFVEKVVPIKKDEKSDDDDDDFDPRADEIKTSNLQIPNEKTTVEIDLLSGSNTDLTQLPLAPFESVASKDDDQDFDPFDTTGVNVLVQPKNIELNLLEKELLSDFGTTIKHSLSDPDFDPRAEELSPKTETIIIKNNYEATARRKSSLSLNISSSGSSQKSVVFSIATPDLLTIGSANGKIQKPLTPYYPEVDEDQNLDDPFDTSFVPTIKPTDIELNILEKDLLTQTHLKHSISDPDFDPRAVTPVPVETPAKISDLLCVDDEHNIKVLTPGTGAAAKQIDSDINYLSDPFDTSSINNNILPGKAELKLIENELLPTVGKQENSESSLTSTTVLDTYTDSQELGLGGKVLTPQIPFGSSFSIEEQDPFDTSFANNLAPGKTEIKLLESELIHQ